MEWKTINNRYGPHTMRLFLGRFHIATVSCNSASKDVNEKYRCEIHLPGMRDNFTNSKHSTECEAMEFAQVITRKWIELAGLNASS